MAIVPIDNSLHLVKLIKLLLREVNQQHWAIKQLLTLGCKQIDHSPQKINLDLFKGNR